METSNNEMKIENWISLILLLILSNMKLFTNIGSLTQIRAKSETIVAGSEMKILPELNNAWMAVDRGRILAFGTMDELNMSAYASAEQVNLDGKFVLPTWVDSHTHLVFAATRETEFGVWRLGGKKAKGKAKQVRKKMSRPGKSIQPPQGKRRK